MRTIIALTCALLLAAALPAAAGDVNDEPAAIIVSPAGGGEPVTDGAEIVVRAASDAGIEAVHVRARAVEGSEVFGAVRLLDAEAYEDSDEGDRVWRAVVDGTGWPNGAVVLETRPASGEGDEGSPWHGHEVALDLTPPAPDLAVTVDDASAALAWPPVPVPDVQSYTVEHDGGSGFAPVATVEPDGREGHYEHHEDALGEGTHAFRVRVARPGVTEAVRAAVSPVVEVVVEAPEEPEPKEPEPKEPEPKEPEPKEPEPKEPEAKEPEKPEERDGPVEEVTPPTLNRPAVEPLRPRGPSTPVPEDGAGEEGGSGDEGGPEDSAQQRGQVDGSSGRPSVSSGGPRVPGRAQGSASAGLRGGGIGNGGLSSTSGSERLQWDADAPLAAGAEPDLDNELLPDVAPREEPEVALEYDDGQAPEPLPTLTASGGLPPPPDGSVDVLLLSWAGLLAAAHMRIVQRRRTRART